MAKKDSPHAEKKESPIREKNRGMRNREFDFERHLADIHGDNPDDWFMIYSHSYNYVLERMERSVSESAVAQALEDTEDTEDTREKQFTQSVSPAQVSAEELRDFLDDAFVLLVYKAPVFKTLGQASAWVMYTAFNLAASEYKVRKKGAANTNSIFSAEVYDRKAGLDFDNMIERMASKQPGYEADPNYRADYDIDAPSQ